MTQHPHISQFFELIESWGHAYTHSTFSFVAMRRDGEFVILASRIRLSAWPRTALMQAVTTPSIQAAEVPIAGNVAAVSAFVTNALAGAPIAVGDFVLAFPRDPQNGSSAYHDHACAPNRGWRRTTPTDYLRLSGARRWDLLNNRLSSLERELQPLGYRDLDGLLSEFDFHLSDADMATIEIAAEPVLQLCAESRLTDLTAHIQIRAAAALRAEDITITLADVPTRGRSIRRSIAGASLPWLEVERALIGTCQLSLPERSVLTVSALYCGCLHDQVELVDPSAVPNPRRAVVELADPGLQKLRGPITAPRSHQEQNDFESGICVLLYMLGFDSVRVGGVKKLSDAADIYATTPSGWLLVVECSTAVLNPKEKLQKLLNRLTETRERMSDGTVPPYLPDQILGVVFIPKARSELGDDWQVALKAGILVLCRDDIELALEMTRLPADADQILIGWRHLAIREVNVNGLSQLDYRV
jgi:hypothetical protein